MSEIYVIMNLERYAEYERKKAANSISKDTDENLNDFVSINQVCAMIKDVSVGKDEKNRYLLDQQGREDLGEAIHTRLHNVALAKLASSGRLECAWDEKADQMVFWTPKPERPDAREQLEES
jgi:hypothetical protein